MSTHEQFHIRDARPDERDAIADLTRAAYQEYATIMTPTAWRGLEQAMLSGLAVPDGAAQRIVAEKDGQLIGSVMLYPPDANAYGDLTGPASYPELRLLAVAASARGLGVGKALVLECLRRAKAMGATAIGLHTSKSLAVARKLYRQLGFRHTPEHDFQPAGAELVEAYRFDLT